MRLSDYDVVFLIAYILGEHYLRFLWAKEENQRIGIDRVIRNQVILSVTLLTGCVLAVSIGRSEPIFLAAGILLMLALQDWLIRAFTQNGRKPACQNMQIRSLFSYLCPLVLIVLACDWMFPLFFNVTALVLDFSTPLRWALLAGLLMTPANALFCSLFNVYKEVALKETSNSHGTCIVMTCENGRWSEYPKEKQHSVLDSGALFGNLERLVTAALIHYDAYTALALIFTAKSLARTRNIETSQRFGEYYFIGTMFSIIYTFLAYRLIIGN